MLVEQRSLGMTKAPATELGSLEHPGHGASCRYSSPAVDAVPQNVTGPLPTEDISALKQNRVNDPTDRCWRRGATRSVAWHHSRLPMCSLPRGITPIVKAAV
mmetsp:Transcript_98332/g.194880  ORF Transcript_98332/g.194880 Transcript_98332/m.194880 type:complete len:102 (-) Transcript_98332:1040-1345(-)